MKSHCLLAFTSAPFGGQFFSYFIRFNTLAQRINRNWLLLFLFLIVRVATAQSIPAPIHITDAFTERNIGLDIALYEDTSAALSWAQIRSPDIDRAFTPSTKPNPSFGFTRSAYWARFGLSAPLQQLYLTLAYSQTDAAELWCTNQDGELLLQQRAGDHVLLAEWPVRHREPTFKISPGAHTCWLRVQTSSSLQLPLTLTSHKAFVQMRTRDTTYQSMYFGALLVMVVFNGLIAATTRSWAYTFYTFFLGSYALFQCSFGGVGYQMLWPDRIGLADTLAPFLVACLGVSSCAFAQIFLDLKNTFPRFYKLGLLVSGLFFVNLIMAWLLPYAFAIRAVMLVVPFWAVFLLGAGIYLSFKAVRAAQIYVAAWLIFILGTLIIVVSRFGFLPINAFTANASQIGSAIEFVMLSLALSYYIKSLQQNLLSEEQKISEQLRISGQNLEAKVQERSTALKLANHEVQQAYTQAEASRQKAEISKIQAEQAQQQAELALQQVSRSLQELQATQTQLVQTEKMAALGLLVSNVAHEINSPMGAIKSSNMTMADSMRATLQNFPKLMDTLGRNERTLFLQLVAHSHTSKVSFTTREERSLTKQVTNFLDLAGLEGSVRKARMLVALRAHSQVPTYLPLLNNPDSDFILSVAAGVGDVFNGSNNIHSAAAKVNRIVTSLKELTGVERTSSMFENHIHQSIEKAIRTLEVQLQNMDVVRHYQDMSPLRCDPELLQQVWQHLILNAAHASGHQGAIMIGLRTYNNHAEIRFTDFGLGIVPEIKDRIFEPFFTTRASGEGGGMGLPIAKKIIEQHRGSIVVETEVGVGSTFTVTLPYSTQAT